MKWEGEDMEFEVTIRLPEAAIRDKAALPRCRDAVFEHGRAGFVVATFVKDGDNQSFEVGCALADIKAALPGATVSRIEFRS